MANYIDEQGTERIDKWLNYACLYKTRAKATKACDERRIKINNEVAKAAKIVKKGDQVTIKSKGGKFTNYTILAVTHQNIPAKEARNLYDKEEIELSPEAKELAEIYERSVKNDRRKFKGRPTKKERRELEKLRGH